MLKFFRKYNKWILGVGGSLLMIVFLIQPVMSMFTANPDNFVLGEFEGGEFTRGEFNAAGGDLTALRPFGLGIDPDGGSDSEDQIRWVLILKDAERLGLNASMTEVKDLIAKAGATDDNVAMIAARMNATPGAIHHAMKNWLIVQKYKGLVSGQAYLSGPDRIRMLKNPRSYDEFFTAMYGTVPISKPLMEHFLQDQGARVNGRAVLIRAERLLDETPKPGDEKVQELFERYKDVLPGSGEPFGFGYRVPDRVKVEYLVISKDAARQHVKVTEADALAHYRKYPERFGGDAESEKAASEPRPYEVVRDDVIDDLKEALAKELVEKMAKAAYGLLYEDIRGMAKQDDYRVIENMATLRPLREVAEQLRSQYGLMADVRSGGGQWVNAEDLVALPGIGRSHLADNERVSFTEFVLSARELKPETDNPLLPRRLQVGLAGAPMEDINHSRYVFRLTEAEPTRVPEQLDEVRAQVSADAWLLAAYEKLLAESDDWLKLAIDDGLPAVASRGNTTVFRLDQVTRRKRQDDGKLAPPDLPTIGQSEAFIQAFFNTANDAREQGGIAEAPAKATRGAAGIDPKLALAIYQIEGFQPMTREQFNAEMSRPSLPIDIYLTTIVGNFENPLSMKSLSARLKFDNGQLEDEEGAEAGRGDAQEDAGSEPGSL